MKEQTRELESDYPSQSILQSKTLMLTEESCFELEQISDLLKSCSISQSTLVCMCIAESLEDVKIRLCKAIGLNDCPSFKSK
jgi:hypothetical protein